LGPPATQAESPEDYYVKAGWLVMACSGQTYGINGSILSLDKRHEQYFFSHDVLRIIPRKDRVCRACSTVRRMVSHHEGGQEIDDLIRAHLKP